MLLSPKNNSKDVVIATHYGNKQFGRLYADLKQEYLIFKVV